MRPHLSFTGRVLNLAVSLMILDYYAGGDLYHLITEGGALRPSLARKLFQQLISGIQFCHEHMIIHRDLKPENLLLSADHQILVLSGSTILLFLSSTDAVRFRPFDGHAGLAALPQDAMRHGTLHCTRGGQRRGLHWHGERCVELRRHPVHHGHCLPPL